MKTSKDTFGNGCVRNIYSFLGMSMPRKVMLREQTLYKYAISFGILDVDNNILYYYEYDK